MSLKVAYNTKEAQSAFGRAEGQPTIGDLLREISHDRSATLGERTALTAQLSGSIGHMPRATPLGYVGSMILGATASNLAAKYFGMGTVGRALSTAVGVGIGSSLYSQVRDTGIPGWSRF